MSVPMKAYVDAKAKALLCLGVAAVVGFAAMLVVLDTKNGRATQVAFEAAEEKGIQHNGLLDRMRDMAGTYITRGNVFSALIAAGVVVGIYSQIRG